MQMLRQLRVNNSKEWFSANQSQIERDVIAPCNASVDELRMMLEKSCGCEMTSKAYRLHRDLRFSKDKTPYHSHFRFSIWPQAVPQDSAVCFHFSVEPERLTMGVGLWEFGDRLSNFRERCGELRGLVSPNMRLSEPELKRAPAGVIVDPELEEHYRRKGITIWIDQPSLDETGNFFEQSSLQSLVPIYAWFVSL